MKIIGITGGIGSGKSTVSRELKKCGAEIVDADEIARQVVGKGKPALHEIAMAFGTEYLTADGELDRKKVAELVFQDNEKLNVLNSITHKYVFEEMRRRMDESTSEIVVLDVPLLFQSDFPFKCDKTIAVLADEELRIRRVIERDGISREEVLCRMSNQLFDEEFKKLADICFENNGDLMQITEFAKEICNF